MKIHQLIIFAVLLGTTSMGFSQDGSPSPYAFFGLGDPVFKGATEKIGMAGLNVYTDSIHYNLNTPASLSRLKYVNLNIGMYNNFKKISDQNSSAWFSAHNVSYFSLAMPIGKKGGFGFGILPVNTSGYQIFQKTDLGTDTYKGNGGNNRLFLSGAYALTKSLSVGFEYQYYFGYIEHENYWIPNGTTTYTKENDYVDFTGSALKFSALYRYALKKQTYLNITANYRLQADLSAALNTKIRVITPLSAGEQTVEVISDTKENGVIQLPSQFDFGLGYGKTYHWFLGAQYTMENKSGFRNTYLDPAYVSYQNSSTIKIGGFYVPQYNSITKYWKRMSYRAGFYYRNTGMKLYNEEISDFGITFGLGLPTIRGISNLNFGVEIGKRGKVTDYLVEEKYINLHIGISLNDKWFIKRKIN